MSNLQLKYPLDNVKETIQKWLFLEDTGIIDIMLAVFIANQIQTDLLWMIFIAPPSSSKTELLRAFSDHVKTYFLSNLTPATLASGKDKKGRDMSLLPKLSGRVLILKDFTSILSMRSESQQEVIGQLREMYDGKYNKSFGTGKQFSWEGHVGLMAACTPVYDKHYGIIASLGDRFLLYRNKVSDNEKMGAQAQKIVGQEKVMREEIQNSIHNFINQFDKMEMYFQQDPSINEMIIKLATFCAYARCPVERDWRHQHILYEPQPEGPARLVKQFMQLGMALAMVHSQNIIDANIYEFVKKVGRDLAPTYRIKILKYFWKEKIFERSKEWKKTKEIATSVNIPVRTTLLYLEDFMLVGLLKRDVETDGETAAYRWQINEIAYKLIEGSEIFEETIQVPF